MSTTSPINIAEMVTTTGQIVSDLFPLIFTILGLVIAFWVGGWLITGFKSIGRSFMGYGRKVK
jgi:hypothetical protein